MLLMLLSMEMSERGGRSKPSTKSFLSMQDKSGTTVGVHTRSAWSSIKPVMAQQTKQLSCMYFFVYAEV